MAKKKYYAVKVGKTPGIYLTWEDCKGQVDGVSGAVYKSFPTLAEAEVYIRGGDGVPSGGGHGAQMGEENRAQMGGGHGTRTGGENGAQTDREYDVLTDPQAAVAYVDGSYNVATGEYSCGVVFLTGTEEIHLAQKGEDRELASMRNVAGEILGAELAMKKALESGIRSLCIYHDYQGIASWCLGEWKTNKEGTRAYKEYFDSICDKVKIRFVKVKGHSGDKFNDLADELAKSVIF